MSKNAVKTAAERAALKINRNMGTDPDVFDSCVAEDAAIISREYQELEQAAEAIDEVIGEDNKMVKGGGKLGVYLTYQQVMALRSALRKVRGQE